MKKRQKIHSNNNFLIPIERENGKLWVVSLGDHIRNMTDESQLHDFAA